MQTHERPPTSEPKVRAGAVRWAGSEGSSWGPWPGPSRLGLHRQAGLRSRPDGRAWRALMTSVTGDLPLCVSPSQSCPDVCCVGLLGSVWPRRPVEPSVRQASAGSACASLCSGGKDIARDGGSARPSGQLALLVKCCFPFRIGRVAGRLPRELADDVLGSVLDCFRYVRRWGPPCG